MGRVYEEFARDMDRWGRQYAGRPAREMLHLLLLALEREELVSVGYRESLMLHRLRAMPIASDVQELIHHALVWAWKDEQMHAVYLRGAILRLGSRTLRARAFLRQIMGMTGGWAGSVRQHVRWTHAPLSHSLASAITGVGSITGQVPRDVREYLRYRPFRDFCLFNVDAEKTAALCYRRMMEVLPELPDASPALRDDMRRIHDDETRHEQIFALAAAALDAEDRLVPGETSQTLARKIGAVGEFFLPRSHRSAADRTRDRIPVWVKQGTSAEEKRPLFDRLLDESGLKEQLEQCATALGKPVGAMRVAIKAAFMLGYSRRDRSHLTDPALLDALARYLREQGCEDIAVVEARNIYDRFYACRTVREVAAYLGYDSPSYRIVDISEEQVPHTYFRGLAQYSVGRTWKEADFRISFGKMRSHAVEQVYLTIGNLDGLGARCDEFLFAERQAHRETATMMLIGDFPPHFALLDAYDLAADGLLGMMGCARPKTPRRLYAGTDMLAVDIVAARHMGLRDPRLSNLLNTACHWFGDPSPQTEVIGPDAPLEGWRGPYHNEWTTLLSFFAYPVYEFGSARGALFVPQMDTEAFPPLARERPLLRMERRFLQTFLGLRLPR